jgi:hypothetical protein
MPGKGYEQYFEILTIVMISALYLKSNYTLKNNGEYLLFNDHGFDRSGRG